MRSSPPSPDASEANGTVRFSRVPRVLALLARMWNSQVYVDRCWKRSSPSMTASHVSWTTSSATASVDT